MNRGHAEPVGLPLTSQAAKAMNAARIPSSVPGDGRDGVEVEISRSLGWDLGWSFRFFEMDLDEIKWMEFRGMDNFFVGFGI